MKIQRNGKEKTLNMLARVLWPLPAFLGVTSIILGFIANVMGWIPNDEVSTFTAIGGALLCLSAILNRLGRRPTLLLTILRYGDRYVCEYADDGVEREKRKNEIYSTLFTPGYDDVAAKADALLYARSQGIAYVENLDEESRPN